jgi:ClpP class serine protease
MWLLRKDVADALHQARTSGTALTAAQVEAFEKRTEASSTGVPRNLKIAGDVAEITIEGVLSNKPDIWAYWFGGGNCTYESIRQSLALAAADPAIKRVVLNIASPGGYVDGLFDTLAALEAFSKPKTTRASQADSAAYALAAMGGSIEATNPAAEFGSVGVVSTYYIDDTIVEITSTNAPNKRPDPTTPEGQAVIREFLDAIHDLFVDAIARGRATTKDLVNANFGRGAVLLAKDAKRLGMIDKIAKPQLRAVASSDAYEGAGNAAPEPVAAHPAPPVAAATATTSPAAAAPTAPTPVPSAPAQDASAASGGAAKARKKMNEEELRAQHPELYSAVFNKGKAEGEKGKAEAVSNALAEEKDRVEGHLIMGEAAGDMKLAIESVRSGVKMNATLQAKYMAAGMNKRDRDARAADEATTDAVVEAARPTSDKGKTKFELVAEAVERQAKGGGEVGAE